MVDAVAGERLGIGHCRPEKGGRIIFRRRALVHVIP
jgi:hypothetical protein